MKKIVLALLLVNIAQLSFSQDTYLDFGLGFSQPFTRFDGVPATEALPADLEEIGTELGLKIGFRLIKGQPLYLLGEANGFSHKIIDTQDDLILRAATFGPAVVYYPWPALQVGGGFAYAFVSNLGSMGQGDYGYDSTGGYAANAHAALDFSSGELGLLVGAKINTLAVTLRTSGVEQNTLSFSTFVKMAFREL